MGMDSQVICLGLGIDPQEPPWTEVSFSGEPVSDHSPASLTYRPELSGNSVSVLDLLDGADVIDLILALAEIVG
jgi:hypothetical protein